MLRNRLQILIFLMAMAIGILSYQYYSSNSNLELYKERYKELAILYLNEVMKAPELLPPISNDDETKKIDFSYNTLQFENLENESFRIQDFKDKILFINITYTSLYILRNFEILICFSL